MDKYKYKDYQRIDTNLLCKVILEVASGLIIIMQTLTNLVKNPRIPNSGHGWMTSGFYYI